MHVDAAGDNEITRNSYCEWCHVFKLSERVMRIINTQIIQTPFGAASCLSWVITNGAELALAFASRF